MMNLQNIFSEPINALLILSGDKQLILDENFREDKVTSNINEFLDDTLPHYEDKNEQYKLYIEDEAQNIIQFLEEENLINNEHINEQYIVDFFKQSKHIIFPDNSIHLSFNEYKNLLIKLIKTIDKDYLANIIKNTTTYSNRKVIFTDIFTEDEIKLFKKPVLLLNVKCIQSNDGFIQYTLIKSTLDTEQHNLFLQNLSYEALKKYNELILENEYFVPLTEFEFTYKNIQFLVLIQEN